MENYQIDGVFSFITNRKLFFGKNGIYLLPSIIQEIGNSFLFILSKSFSNSDTWNNLFRLINGKGKVFIETVSGEPTVDSIDLIVNKYRERVIDVVIGIGGGSVIDTAKAVSVMLMEDGSVEEYLEGIATKKPIGIKKFLIAVPTTFGTGSEATKNAVIGKIGVFKRSLRHDNFVPDIAIIDPTLGYDVPVSVRISSGLDALTQLIEAYTSLKSNLYSDSLCEKAFYLVGKSFEKVIFNQDPTYDDFSNVALASYYSGVCLANVGLGVVHGFASVIGGMFGIPHGVVCGSLLYPAVLKNLQKLIDTDSRFFLEKYSNIGNLIYGKCGGFEEGIERLKLFLERISSLAKLRKFSEYGVSERDIDNIVSKTSLKENPVKLDKNDLIEILKQVL